MAGRIRRIWEALKRPPVRLSLGAVFDHRCGICAGGLGGFVFVMEKTGTNDFCANACHEMNTSFAEYQQSVHARNTTGVTATCSQCHIPQHSMAKGHPQDSSGMDRRCGQDLGVISTPEKFEAHRKAMAEKSGPDMKENDSRECRFCHDRNAMDPEARTDGSRQHAKAAAEGMTCIDCHQGIAHKLPEEPPEPAAAPAAQPAGEGTIAGSRDGTQQ